MWYNMFMPKWYHYKQNRYGRSRGSLSPGMIKKIWERDNAVCIYCGAPAQVIDHVIPCAKDGPTRMDNLVLACRPCNYAKRDKLNEEFLTKGIFHLMRYGYTMDWVDKLT